MKGDEFARIAAIAATAGARARGLGDDCALVPGGVVTVDACVEGVHFPAHDALPAARFRALLEDVGHRATVAAASDVLAMGAAPRWILAAWTLPPWLDDDGVVAVARGQRDALDALDATLVGGNLSSGPVLSITTTVFGQAERPVGRDGARAGDLVVAAGALGEASLGFTALGRGLVHRCVDVWCRPPVLVRESAALAAGAHALIDVSDGLAQDVGHVAAASGLAVELDETALLARVADDARALAHALGADLSRAVLAGGEDYALVGAWPPGRPLPPSVDVIGRFATGEGVRVRSVDGRLVDAPAGHRHGGG